MRFFFSHHGLHSAGCLVTGNTHLFTRAAKCATVSLFKLLTQHHQHHIYTLASWLLQYVLSTAFSTNPSLSLSLSPSVSHGMPNRLFFFFSTRHSQYLFCSSSPSLSSGVSESWAETGGPWQKVGRLVLQVTPHRCGSPRAEYSPAVIWHVCGLGGCFCFVGKCTAVRPHSLHSLTVASSAS